MPASHWMLPALKTNAQPLRFLDFLIRDPAPAVLPPGELKDVWEEGYERGTHWRKYLSEGMRNLAAHGQNLLLRIPRVLVKSFRVSI
jgi:hypothetical protein